MQYDLSAEEVRALMARKAWTLENYAKYNMSGIGGLAKEDALRLIDELATLAGGLPSRPEEPAKKAA